MNTGLGHHLYLYLILIMNNKTLLILGIVFGLCFILLGIVLPKNKIEDKNVVVSVNGHPIFQSDWDLALQALAMNKRNEITNSSCIAIDI